MDVSSALIAGERNARSGPDPASFPIMAFGDFVALPAARTLFLEGEPICVGARAFDLLMLLLANRGRVVGKAEIMDYVWPTTTVDESNLRFQVAVLRKALGPGRDIIKTIPGRGYFLAADVGNMEAPPQRATLETPSDGQRAICEALNVFLNIIDRHPAALSSVRTLLAAYLPQMTSAGADAVRPSGVGLLIAEPNGV